MAIHLLKLQSPLHDENVVNKAADDFIEAVMENLSRPIIEVDEPKDDKTPLVVYITTGGVEGLYAKKFPKGSSPVYLLTHHSNNSLPAALEIADFERQRGNTVEVLHGTSEKVAQRLAIIEGVYFARASLEGARFGIIGQPSDWLIAAKYSKEWIKSFMGIELIDIPLSELEELLDEEDVSLEEEHHMAAQLRSKAKDEESIDKALAVHRALRKLCKSFRLDGFTIRCFDMVTKRKTTACLALSLLNSDGVLAGCEGDVPAMLSMILLRALSGQNAFQANPSFIDEDKNEVTFAHCTIPIDLPFSYELDTHFESGLGVAIKGKLKKGPATVFKMNAYDGSYFVSEGTILEKESDHRLCRTQVSLHLAEAVSYFFHGAIGNHHIIAPGSHGKLIKEYFSVYKKVTNR